MLLATYKLMVWCDLPHSPTHPLPHIILLFFDFSRYKVCVEIPVQRSLFRVLPSFLQEGKEVDVVVVLFTQGINEQQSLADRYGSKLFQ